MKQVSITTDTPLSTLSNNSIGRLKRATGLRFFLLLSVFTLFLSSCQKEYIQTQDQIRNTQISSSQTLQSVQSKSVTFTLLMDFSTNPAFGTFTATGALNTSGTAELDYNPNKNFVTAHNVITLTTNQGIITIHDECEFAINNAFPAGRGSWQIVSGTGIYANIKGSGQESFPSATEDILSGIMY